MQKINQFIPQIAVFILLFPFVSKSAEISFSCDSNQRLTNVRFEAQQSDQYSDFIKKVNLDYKQKPKANQSHLSASPECSLAYFFDTPYMYVTGRRFDSVNHSAPPVQCNHLDQFIENALLANQDPYAALAISLLENKTSINDLYLDPIGVVDNLGCSGKSLPSRKGSNLESFETYYKMDFDENIKNKELANEIKNALKSKEKELNIEIKNENAFICSKKTSVSFEKKKLSNQCCLETDFYPAYKGSTSQENDSWNSSEMDMTSINDSTQVISKILTFKSLDKYISRSLPSKYANKLKFDKAAFRAQRFNGLAQFSGGAENMPAWRSGINFTEDPGYGYQALDFIFNVLLTNEIVTQKVALFEKKLNKSPKNLVCLDLEPGQHTLSNDYYKDKHKNSKRFKEVYTLYLKNKPNFLKLAKNHQKVLKNEFHSLCTLEKNLNFMNSQLPDYNQFLNNCGSAEKQFSYYMEKIYPFRNTIGKTSQMEQSFSWEAMTSSQIDLLIRRMNEAW